MAMTWIWTGMVVLSLVFGLFTGNLDAVADAAMDGAASAVELSVSMAGILCLWSGVMEIMNVCGLSAGLARAFRPILRRLMPQASRDEKTLAALSANVSANLLGLGNAATPLGIQAARRMARGCSGTASDELCLLVVLNTASIQLLPATIASVRSASGAAVSLRHPAGGVAGLGPVGGGWRSDGQIPGRRGEVPALNLSSLVIPVLLAGVALYGMGKRVDVYGALTHGAEEGSRSC